MLVQKGMCSVFMQTWAQLMITYMYFMSYNIKAKSTMKTEIIISTQYYIYIYLEPKGTQLSTFHISTIL